MSNDYDFFYPIIEIAILLECVSAVWQSRGKYWSKIFSFMRYTTRNISAGKNYINWQLLLVYNAEIYLCRELKQISLPNPFLNFVSMGDKNIDF